MTSSTSTPSGGGGEGAATGSGGSGGDWLHDPSLWEPVAADIPCDMHTAKLPSDKVPRRTWSSCGVGCLRAPVVLEGQTHADVVVASEIGGEIYYRVSTMTKDSDDEVVAVNEVARLSDDEPVNLLRARGRCQQLSDFNSPLLFWVWEVDGTPPAYFGLAAAPGAQVVWQLPAVVLPTLGKTPFYFDGGWGLIENTSTVKVATTPGSSAFETVFASPGYALHPFGRGAQVVWSDWSDYDWQTHRARVRSWTQAGGTVELAGGPYDVMYVALSDTKMVWIGGYGPGSVEGATESEQLFWSPRATSPGGVVIHDGPVVPHTQATTGYLVTHGDWVATVTNYWEQHNVVVVNLATAAVWSIPSRAGKRFAEVMAIDGGSLLVDERDLAAETYPDSIVRLDLAELDSLAQAPP